MVASCFRLTVVIYMDLQLYTGFGSEILKINYVCDQDSNIYSFKSLIIFPHTSANLMGKRLRQKLFLQGYDGGRIEAVLQLFNKHER